MIDACCKRGHHMHVLTRNQLGMEVNSTKLCFTNKANLSANNQEYYFCQVSFTATIRVHQKCFIYCYN